jgi:hypothetical protein
MATWAEVLRPAAKRFAMGLLDWAWVAHSQQSCEVPIVHYRDRVCQEHCAERIQSQVNPSGALCT